MNVEEILVWVGTALVAVVSALFVRGISHGRTGRGTVESSDGISDGIDKVENGIKSAEESVGNIAGAMQHVGNGIRAASDTADRIGTGCAGLEDKLGRAKEILREAHKERGTESNGV